MEHRWGVRQMLEVGVKLYVQPDRPLSGRLLNASSSGGYVTTSVTVPIMTRVDVTIGCDNSQRGGLHRIAGYVVRADARGVGIEWQDFAPPPVLALIAALQVRPSRESRRPRARVESPLLAQYPVQAMNNQQALVAMPRT